MGQRCMSTILPGVIGLARKVLSVTMLALLIACAGDDETPTVGVADAAQNLVATNNLGVGHMGRFEYSDAMVAFAKVLEIDPHWSVARVNLAIATLNRQEEGDEQAALGIVEDVLAGDPGQTRARYVAALLYLYLGLVRQSAEHLRIVTREAPDDAYAAYYMGQTLAQQGEHEQALVWYRRAVMLDPYLRSGYYGVFQALRHLRKVQEAREVMVDYQRLARNPRARLAEFKYTRMGPLAEALAVGIEPPAPSLPPSGPVFGKSQPILAQGPRLAQPYPARRPVGLSAADVDGNGQLDLFIAATGEGGATPNVYLAGNGDGGFTLRSSHPLAQVPGVNAALWGDYDNDGLVDVYLCRRGTNALWRQRAPGEWQDVSASTGTAGGELDTVDGAFFDADHDGDLDLFLVNRDGPNELLNNNLDGTFRPLGVAQGLDGGARASRTVLTADLDGDRDVDIVVINTLPPHDVYLNDRLWAYHPASEDFDSFRASEALTGLAADLDSDGRSEIYTVAPQGSVLRWAPHGSGSYIKSLVGALTETQPAWAQLARADADGDGVLDLLVASPSGWRVLGRDRVLYSSAMAEPPLHGVLPITTDPVAGPAVLAWRSGSLYLWPPGPGRYEFLTLRFSGRRDSGHGMRSNASGVGVYLALRVGARWTVESTFRGHSGPGQSLQPIALGLGGVRQADFLSIDWSDGVYQSELALEAGGLQEIAETQRQLSSCPVLFAWNGREYAFVSDLLGVAGIGYALGPGQYATPRPWEHLLLPLGALQARDGRLLLKLAEPMEEVAYLDSARLVAHDLPPGWNMAVDDRMVVTGPPATGNAVYFREELIPVRAVNEDGADQLDRIVAVDSRAAHPGSLDRRFIGRLQAEHLLTLEFSQPLDDVGPSPVLVADGWVEYPYSQTMFAAWQAGATFDAPTLEARGIDGVWRVVLEQFGYPAGMPRRMSVPLQRLPAGTRDLRIRSNMEVYWDRISVVRPQSSPRVRRIPLELLGARLAQTGFARRTTTAQRVPHYDYGHRAPYWDTRYMEGSYTRFGPVDELVAKIDDALVLIGPGEEVHLEYAAVGAPPSKGWRRYYVLEANGWAKDMDLFTRDGDRVGPLPGRGSPSDTRARLHSRYHTRYMAGK